MKKYLIGTVVFAAIMTNLSAGCAPASKGGVCSNIDITRLYVVTAGTYVGTSGDEKKVGAGCKAIASVYFLLKKTHPNYQTMHSTLLAAQLSGKKANVRVLKDATTGNCNLAYMTITD